jgi:hypothetical protein
MSRNSRDSTFLNAYNVTSTSTQRICAVRHKQQLTEATNETDFGVFREISEEFCSTKIEVLRFLEISPNLSNESGQRHTGDNQNQIIAWLTLLL